MEDTEGYEDPGAFAAELKAIAETVVKTKPLTKTQLIATDEVWEAIMEMKTAKGMNNADIAEVFKAKGWIEANADNMGYLIREAAKLRGDEPEGRKGRKAKTTSKRSPAASTETSSNTSSETDKPRAAQRADPASRKEGVAAAEGKSKPKATDAKPNDQAFGSGKNSDPVNPAYTDRKRL